MNLNRQTQLVAAVRTLAAVLPLALVVSCATSRFEAQPMASGAPTNEPAEPVAEAPFVLDASDQIIVNVWRHDDLSRTVQVDPSGHIWLPLAGKVRAAGLTIEALSEEIASGLKKYFKNPQVDVTISDLAGQRCFVLGEVEKAGRVLLEGDMCVWEAIAEAGGLSDDANRKKALLIRSRNGKVTVRVLRLTLAERNGQANAGLTTPIRRRDILYVPKSVIASVEDFMKRVTGILNPIMMVESGIAIWPRVVDALESRDEDREAIFVVSP